MAGRAKRIRRVESHTAFQGCTDARSPRAGDGRMNAPCDVGYDAYMGESLKDPAALLVALRRVAKARGMAEVARRAYACSPCASE